VPPEVTLQEYRDEVVLFENLFWVIRLEKHKANQKAGKASK
jgi:hypothetical protein